MTNARSMLAAFVLTTVGVASPAQPPALTPVEAGFEDVSPAAAGLRVQRPDLRAPTGFDRLYRIAPGTRIGGVTIRDGGFARISGSTVAVFPRGSYRSLGPGIASADVPAGTMYLQSNDVASLIGGAPEPSSTPRHSTLPQSLVRRIEHGPGPQSVVTSSARSQPASVSEADSMWHDGGYRERRLAQLLQLTYERRVRE